jgi:signal transduction histidine kinase
MQDELAEQAALRERVKELTCLYALAQLADRQGISLEEVLQGTAELLPPAWQHAEVAAARIVLDARPYATAGFREDGQAQSAAIMIDGQRRGRVDVVYTEPRPVRDEGPFLKEERNLIDAVARQLGLIIQRRKADEDAKRLQDQLRHADRLATIGQLAAGVAHEVNEPLSNILGFAQLAQRHQGLPEPAARDLEKVVASALHAREIVRKLMLFARQTPPQKTPISLNAVVEDGLSFLESRCARNGVVLVRKLSGSLPTIDADPSQLNQVLVNLVVNAIQAMPEGGVLTVATGASAGWAWLVVEDTGAGMSQEVLNQIFTPFFTTKDVDEGTGLGLPVVHGIVSGHNGTIRVQSAPGRGTRFEVRLPVHTDARMGVTAPQEEDRAGDEAV